MNSKMNSNELIDRPFQTTARAVKGISNLRAGGSAVRVDSDVRGTAVHDNTASRRRHASLRDLGGSGHRHGINGREDVLLPW